MGDVHVLSSGANRCVLPRCQRGATVTARRGEPCRPPATHKSTIMCWLPPQDYLTDIARAIGQGIRGEPPARPGEVKLSDDVVNRLLEWAAETKKGTGSDEGK